MGNRITRKRVLLVSCAVILLCFCMIAGGTYALFTDSVTSNNHLEAGKLDIELLRTNLVTRTLDTDGYLQNHEDKSTISFANSNADNLFGIGQGTKIIPGSFFDASLTIQRGETSNVAFSYGVTIKLNSTPNALAEQLLVTIVTYDADGNEVEETKKMSELANGHQILVGVMDNNSTEENFKVRIDFEDSNPEAGKPEIEINNNAMLQTVDFDLVVIATQATK